jgi:hypothetical protein
MFCASVILLAVLKKFDFDTASVITAAIHRLAARLAA